MWRNVWEFFKPVVVVVSVVVAVAGVVSPIVYHSCRVTAKVVNEEFGTSYVWSDILWAGDAIENIVLGQKARYEVNINERR